MAESLGILGPAGTHSEAAANYLENFLGTQRRLVPYREIYEVLQATKRGEVAAALVPVENSLEGSVNITLDVLAGSDDLTVVRELVWPVRNFLMGKPGLGTIRKIYSHSQPISQCRHYLQTHQAKAEILTAPSTARAAQIVAEAPLAEGCAAICPARAGEIYRLSVLAADVQDNPANSTRFFELRCRSREFDGKFDTDGLKVLIICQIDGQRAGSLCEVLTEFASRKVNLTRIESRPARTKLGEYIFFFDLEAEAGGADGLRAAVEAVRRKSIWLKNLGSFPVIMAKEQKE